MISERLSKNRSIRSPLLGILSSLEYPTKPICSLDTGEPLPAEGSTHARSANKPISELRLSLPFLILLPTSIPQKNGNASFFFKKYLFFSGILFFQWFRWVGHEKKSGIFDKFPAGTGQTLKAYHSQAISRGQNKKRLPPAPVTLKDNLFFLWKF